MYTAFFISALFSPFIFPWYYTATLAVLASWKYPFAALVVGIEFDVLYLPSHSSFVPFGTIIGVVVTVLAFFIQHIMKTYVRSV